MTDWIKKLRRMKGITFLAVGLGAGLLLLLLGGTEKTEDAGKETDVPSAAEQLEAYTAAEETRLARLLDEIAGVSHVSVHLTLQHGIADLEIVGGDERYTAKGPPAIAGCAVVCRGAERAEIRLAIITAVCSLYGIPSSRVAVYAAG